MDCRQCPMKSRIKLLEGIILRGEPVPIPDLDAAIEACRNGDVSLLVEYKRKGGVIPDVPDHDRRGGRRVKTTNHSEGNLAV